MRMNKIIVVIFSFFLLFSPISAIETTVYQKQDSETCCIIENVTSMSQQTGYYCRFASVAIVVNYFVENVSLGEVLFHSGIGYTHLYFRPFKLQPLPGIFVCQLGSFSGNLLGELYGLKHDIWKPKNKNTQWDEYWSVLKEKICKKIPVITDVDPFTMPWYKTNAGLTGDRHSGHSIVIVGHNESAGVVYYNDPGAMLLDGTLENSTYIPLKIDIFKDALENNSFPNTKFMIETFEKISEPLDTQERYNAARQANIDRLCGDFSGSILNFIPFTDYGIKAVKSMKKDLRIGLSHRFSTILMMRLFDIFNMGMKIDNEEVLRFSYLGYKIISVEKQNISQYLMNNTNLSNTCELESNLLLNESKHWENMVDLDNKLFLLVKNGLLKNMVDIKKTINEMKIELDHIFRIEEEIINL